MVIAPLKLVSGPEIAYLTNMVSLQRHDDTSLWGYAQQLKRWQYMYFSNDSFLKTE
jgi:hypothetical protein